MSASLQGNDLALASDRNGSSESSNIDAATLSIGHANNQAWMERFTRNFKHNGNPQPFARHRSTRKAFPLEAIPTRSKFGDEVVSKVLLLARWKTRARQQADNRGYTMAPRRPLLAHFREVTQRTGCVYGAAMEHDGIEPHVLMKLQKHREEEDERIAKAAAAHLKDFTPMDAIRERVKRAMSGVQLWGAGPSRAVDAEDEDSRLGFADQGDDDDGAGSSGLPGEGASLLRRSPLTRSRKLAPGSRGPAGAAMTSGELQPETPAPWCADETEEELETASGSLPLRAASDPGDGLDRVSYTGSVLAAGATSDDEVVRRTNDGMAWEEEGHQDGIAVTQSQGGGAVLLPPLQSAAAVRQSTATMASDGRAARAASGAVVAVGVEERVVETGRGGPTADAALISCAALEAGGGELAAAAARLLGGVSSAPTAAARAVSETAVAAALRGARSLTNFTNAGAGALEAPEGGVEAVMDPRVVSSGPKGVSPGAVRPLAGTLQLVAPYQAQLRVLEPAPGERLPALGHHYDSDVEGASQPREGAMGVLRQPQGEESRSSSTTLDTRFSQSTNLTEVLRGSVPQTLQDVSPGPGIMEGCSSEAMTHSESESAIADGNSTNYHAAAASSVTMTRQTRGRHGAAVPAAGRGAARPQPRLTVPLRSQAQGPGPAQGSSPGAARRVAREQHLLNSRAVGGRACAGAGAGVLLGERSDPGEIAGTARGAAAPQPSASSFTTVDLSSFFGRPKGQPPTKQKFNLAGGTSSPKRTLGHAASELVQGGSGGGGMSAGLGAAAATAHLAQPAPLPTGAVKDRFVRKSRAAAAEGAHSDGRLKDGDTNGDHTVGGSGDMPGPADREEVGGSQVDSSSTYQFGQQLERTPWLPDGVDPHGGIGSVEVHDTVSLLLRPCSPTDGSPCLQIPAGEGDAAFSGEVATRFPSSILDSMGRTSPSPMGRATPRSSHHTFLPHFDTSPTGALASGAAEAGPHRILTMLQSPSLPLPAVGHGPASQQPHGKVVSISAVPGPAGQFSGGPTAAAFGRMSSPVRLSRAVPDSPSLLHRDILPLQLPQPQPLQQQQGWDSGQEPTQGQGQGEPYSPNGGGAGGRVMQAAISPSSLSRLGRTGQDDFPFNGSGPQQPVMSPGRTGPQRSAASLTAMQHPSLLTHPLSQPQPQLARQHLAPLKPSCTTHSAPFVAAVQPAVDEIANSSAGISVSGGSFSGGGAPPMHTLPSPGPGQRNLSRLASESIGAIMDLTPSPARLAPVVPSHRAVGAGTSAAAAKAFLPELRPSAAGRDLQAAPTRGLGAAAVVSGGGGRAAAFDGQVMAAGDHQRTALALASQSVSGEDRLPEISSTAFLSVSGAAPTPLSGLVRGLTGSLAQQQFTSPQRVRMVGP